LKPEFADSIRNRVLGFAAEVWDLKTLPDRLGEAELVEFVRSQLDQGMPREPREPREALFTLARSRSRVVLPMVEAKMEQVIQARDAANCFLDKSIKPNQFLALAASMIAEAGDEEALRQAAKLLNVKNNEAVVFMTLSIANSRGNPFDLAYRGLEMKDPGLTRSITDWAEKQFAEPMLNFPKDMRHQWAESMRKRYGSALAPGQWSGDPLASRLKPELIVVLQSQMSRLSQ
jgi:hypothetical protein